MFLFKSRPDRVWRVYHCPRCNHHLRFGATSCGHCYRMTPPKNWILTWVVLIVGAVAGLVSLV